MLMWALINAALSILAFVFVAINKNSPHRLRFHISFLALSAWLIPWQYLSGIFEIFTPDLQLGITSWAAQMKPDIENSTTITMWSWFPENSGTLLLYALFVGACIFVYKLIHQSRFLNDLKCTVSNGDYLWDKTKEIQANKNVEIKIQNNFPGAWNSGLFTPVIWVNSKLVDSPDLPAILLHESIHIKNHDNLYLCVITLIESLFWWNSLVLFMGKIARNNQELACDDQCANDFSNYKLMLNNLILSLCTTEDDIFVISSINTGIFQDKNFNIIRVQSLQRSYTMKQRHYLSIACLISASVISIGFVSAQDTDESRQEIIDTVAEKKTNDPDYERTYSVKMVAGLAEYATRLEQAYVKLEEETINLRSQVLELEKEITNLR